VDVYARLSDERMQDAIGHGDTRIRSSAGSIGVQITIPIFTGGMRSAKRDEAAALVQKAEHDIATVRQEVLRQTQAAWLATRSGIARVRAQEQAVRSAGSRLDATAVGNEVGARTTLDLLNAQSDFYHAQRNLEQVKYQLLLDRLRLAATAGELGEATLREVNAVLTDSR
jgi:outer membrane protein